MIIFVFFICLLVILCSCKALWIAFCTNCALQINLPCLKALELEKCTSFSWLHILHFAWLYIHFIRFHVCLCNIYLTVTQAVYIFFKDWVRIHLLLLKPRLLLHLLSATPKSIIFSAARSRQPCWDKSFVLVPVPWLKWFGTVNKC